MKCTLPSDINKCPYFQAENQECDNTNACSFQERETKKESTRYLREERWYEKYIK